MDVYRGYDGLDNQSNGGRDVAPWGHGQGVDAGYLYLCASAADALLRASDIWTVYRRNCLDAGVIPLGWWPKKTRSAPGCREGIAGVLRV